MNKDKQEAFETFNFDTQPIRGFPELRWAGKRPFRSTQYFPAQKKESYGDPVDGWMNKVFWGDNLQVMSHLLRDYRNKVQLIYIDPPFDSNADYKKAVSLKSGTAVNDHTSFEEKQYTDIWNHDNYLQFIFDRLILCRELLSDSGSLFLHCDSRKSHHIRAICDEVFGGGHFQNDIIWKRRGGRTSTTGSKPSALESVADTILWYTRTDNFVSNPIFSKSESEDYIKKRFTNSDADGRKFRLSPLNSPNFRANLVYEYKGYKPHSNGWSVSLETMQRYDEMGILFFPEDKSRRIQRKQYLDNWEGKSVQSIWTDIPPINPQAKERLGYPTQKPEALISRIIEIGSNPGDLVLDVFMGSGTTQAVAYKMGRKFLGADINLGAIETTIKRLSSLSEIIDNEQQDFISNLNGKNETQKFTGVELYNVNNYDLFRNPVEAKELISEAMELQPLPGSNIFDGQRDQYLVKIMPVNRIATRQDLNEIITGLDFKAFERRLAQAPSKPVERIHLVCMGHEPDLGAELKKEAKPYDVDVIITDLIRDKSELHFKRESDAKLEIINGKVIVAGFYPMNLLQKLSLQSGEIEDWRQLVESIKVDFNYDGAVLTPSIVDLPDNKELVIGSYDIPEGAGTIRIKITDLLSESWEGEIENG